MNDLSLAERVDALPELYQPVWSHPEFDSRASRPGHDRLASILRAYDALSAAFGRPLRVLDLGCAQGFFSCGLAARGAQVRGIDSHTGNINFCRAIATEHAAFQLQFSVARLEDELAMLETDRHDLVLGLNVFHHHCHQHGVEATRQLIARLQERVPVALVESALREEPMSWAPSQPADPLAYLSSYAFVHALSMHATHLSAIKRPLFFCSSRYWFLGGTLERFSEWTDQHEVGADILRGTRRYFFSRAHLAKQFRLDGDLSSINRKAIESEVQFLERPVAGLPHVPKLVAYGSTDRDAWLVRDLIPGRRLSQVLASGKAVDREAVMRAVLDELVTLERQGLAHADVRTWNVLLTDDGGATLIDYGAISDERKDCVWPHDIHLSFLLFLRDVATGAPPSVYPSRDPQFAPGIMDERFARFASAIWACPVEQWTFGKFRELLDAMRDGSLTSSATVSLSATLLRINAIESNLELIGRELAQARIWMNREWQWLERQREIDHVTSVLHSRVGAVESGLGSAGTQLTTLDASLISARSEGEAAAERTGALESRLATDEETARELSESMDGLRLAVRGMESRVLSDEETASRLRDSLDEARRAARIARLDAQRLVAEVGMLRDAVGSLDRESAALKRRWTRRAADSCSRMIVRLRALAG